MRDEDRRRWRQRFADSLLDPPPLGTDIWFGEDVPTKATADLRAQRSLLRVALMLDPDPWGWRAARLATIEAELQARVRA
ncbi:MAG: hypothetical protein ACRDHY_17190 [Anaerolineales bacterium]